MKSAKAGHASLGATVCSHVGVRPQGVPKHLHSHTTLEPSLPHPHSQQHHHLVPPDLFWPPIPNSFSKLPLLSPWPYLWFSHSKTVKQPHNRSGALSLIMDYVYYRFHAPPHRQPIFPHIHACMRIFKRIDVQARIHACANSTA